MDVLSTLWQFGVFVSVLIFGVKLGLATGLAGLSKKHLLAVCIGYGGGILVLSAISSIYTSQITGLINTYNSYSNHDKSVASENTDGYSITYAQATENVSKAKINEIKDIIKTYLAECKLADGTPYLYAGVE